MESNYRLIRPDRCCGNCAYGSYSEKELDRIPLMMHRCAWMDFAFSGGDGNRLSIRSLGTPDFDRCGLCDKWLPRRLALCFRGSSSFDEFRLKKLAFGFGDFQTDELDDWFAERKATDAQLRAVSFVSCRPGKVPPAMASPLEVDDDGRIHELRQSNSFYTVQDWLSKNMDSRQKAPDGEDLLAEMMM